MVLINVTSLNVKMSANVPEQTSATRPKARLSSSDPTNACGGPALRKADHVEKRDPRSDDNKH